jgi:hypothetical protein
MIELISSARLGRQFLVSTPITFGIDFFIKIPWPSASGRVTAQYDRVSSASTGRHLL